MNKKILIISNEPLSNSSSNGRTLRNFLLNIPREQIAQFSLHGVPDKDVCTSCFRVSDEDALNAFLFRKKKVQKDSTQENRYSAVVKKVSKNCKTMVLRDIVWRSYRWWGKDFSSFINDFKPDVLLLQAGDAPFMFDIALRISKKYKLPIVMYNSENYVLKEKMYSDVNGFLWHKILQNRLRAVYSKFMKNVSYCIYSTEYLEDEYQKKYPHASKSCALYTASELKPLKNNNIDNIFSMLYCGNLGVGRVDSLCELAQVLYAVDSTARFDIYGKLPDDESRNKLCLNPNVYYGGVVPYDEVKELMSKASMLVHCENEERLEDLCGAFSTKIADNLSSGKPFLVYATRKYPFVQYLEKYECAHIASDMEELERVLKKCTENPDYRNRYIKNAKNIALMNHSTELNCLRVEKILNEI